MSPSKKSLKGDDLFEYQDEKIGKVKVVNVTDARSHIATIMSDTSCSYIITKNNKPVRVVVNYEDFKATNGMLSPSIPENISNPMRGMIQSREIDVKAQKSLITESILKPSNPKPIINEIKVEPPMAMQPEMPEVPVAPEMPTPEESIPSNQRHRRVEGESPVAPRSGTRQDVANLDQRAPFAEQTVSGAPEALIQATLAPIIETEYPSSEASYFNQPDELIASEPIAPQPTDEAILPEENVLIEDAMMAAPEQDQQDYDTYKPVPCVPLEEETAIEIINEEKAEQTPEESYSEIIEEEVEEAPMIKTITPPPDDDYFSRFKKLYEPRPYAAKPTPPRITDDEVKPVYSYQPPKNPEEYAAPVMPKKNSLPSIQDLLRDLEEEKI